MLLWFSRFSDNRVRDCGISWYAENAQSFSEGIFIDHNGPYLLF